MVNVPEGCRVGLRLRCFGDVYIKHGITGLTDYLRADLGVSQQPVRQAGNERLGCNLAAFLEHLLGELVQLGCTNPVAGKSKGDQAPDVGVYGQVVGCIVIIAVV